MSQSVPCSTKLINMLETHKAIATRWPPSRHLASTYVRILPKTNPRYRDYGTRVVLVFLNIWQLSPEYEISVQNMKNYRAQTPQNLALTKILQNFRKMSTSQLLDHCTALWDHFNKGTHRSTAHLVFTERHLVTNIYALQYFVCREKTIGSKISSIYPVCWSLGIIGKKT